MNQINGWHVVGLLMLAIAVAGALSAIAGSINGARREQAMIRNENRRRMNVARRYFADDDLARLFRDERGIVMSVHRQSDGAAIVFADGESFAGHVYTGPGRAAV